MNLKNAGYHLGTLVNGPLKTRIKTNCLKVLSWHPPFSKPISPPEVKSVEKKT